MEEIGQRTPNREPVLDDPRVVDSPRTQLPSLPRGSPTIRINPTSPIFVEGAIGPIPTLPDASAFEEWGIDVLAYYLPFHFNRRRWGIYLRSHGIVHLASLLKKGPLGIADARTVQLARDILFEHEFFHFLTEAAATRCEFYARRKLYRPYYAQAPAWNLEEALANAHAFRRTIRRDAAVFHAQVFGIMKRSPVGYRDFDNFLGPSKFVTGQRDAVAFVMTPITPVTRPSPWPTEFLFPWHRAVARPHLHRHGSAFAMATAREGISKAQRHSGVGTYKRPPAAAHPRREPSR